MLAACVGPVTAAPLRQHGVPVVEPTRARLGALARTIVDELPKRAPVLQVGGRQLAIRGHAVLVDGELRQLAAGADGGAAGARRRGRAGAVPGRAAAPSCHAAPTSTRSRWRWPGYGPALGDGDHIQTVVKRGYRLRVDP